MCQSSPVGCASLIQLSLHTKSGAKETYDFVLNVGKCQNLRSYYTVVFTRVLLCIRMCNEFGDSIVTLRLSHPTLPLPVVFSNVTIHRLSVFHLVNSFIRLNCSKSFKSLSVELY